MDTSCSSFNRCTWMTMRYEIFVIGAVRIVGVAEAVDTSMSNAIYESIKQTNNIMNVWMLYCEPSSSYECLLNDFDLQQSSLFNNSLMADYHCMRINLFDNLNINLNLLKVFSNQ